MVLLKTILVLALVYYSIKILFKWFAPKIFNYAVKKTEERFGSAFENYQSTQEQPTADGNTILRKDKGLRSNPSKKVGEYIDFEEID